MYGKRNKTKIINPSRKMRQECSLSRELNRSYHGFRRHIDSLEITMFVWKSDVK